MSQSNNQALWPLAKHTMNLGLILLALACTFLLRLWGKHPIVPAMGFHAKWNVVRRVFSQPL